MAEVVIVEFVDEIGIDEAEQRDGEWMRGFYGGIEAMGGNDKITHLRITTTTTTASTPIHTDIGNTIASVVGTGIGVGSGVISTYSANVGVASAVGSSVGST